MIPVETEVLEETLLASTSGQRTMKPAEEGKTPQFVSCSARVSSRACLKKQAQHVCVLFFVVFGSVASFCPDAAAQVGEPVPAPARHGRRPHSCRQQDSKAGGYRMALILDPVDCVSLVADSLCREAAG